MIPRPYQSRALDELWGWFLKHDGGNPIVEACVGAGKSLMIALLAQRANAELPGTRVLVLVHQKELLEQNVEKLIAVWPQADVGIYSAGAGRKDLGCQITYATIGSIWKDAHKLGRIDIVLADECHLINPKEEGMWRSFLNDLARYCPSTRTIGWTGTPFRGNGVWLTAGDTPLFTNIATRVTMRELLELRFLTPLVPAATQTRVAAQAVLRSEGRASGDDYVVSELAKVTDTAELVEATCDEIVQLAADRKRWLVFAVTIAHAEHVRDALRQRGVVAEMVSSKTPKAERAQLIADFRAGRIRCLVNVAVLTTGFDVPAVDFIALLRATKSPVLYVQIAGRGMRLSDGKTDCLWADFTDTTVLMGPVDAVKGRLPSGKRKGEAPTRLCPECGSQNPASAPQCIDCGYTFPEPERIKHGIQASSAAVLSSQLEEMFKQCRVTEVRYYLHRKEASPTSLRVEYYDGFIRVASEWVCLGHTGFARIKAEQWWMQRSKIDAIPNSAEDAVEWLEYDSEILRKPSMVTITAMEKYPKIVSYSWQPIEELEEAWEQM
jgi:DNA repair protein RadD